MQVAEDNQVMSTVVHLRLPPPSNELLIKIREYADSCELNLDSKRWLDEFHNNKINSVLASYTIADVLTCALRNRYQQYFSKHEISIIIGLMKNIKDIPACGPPHTDSRRSLAINYYVELGGDNVRTVFYNIVLPSTGEATNIPYDNILPISEHVFQQDWYAFNVNRCHSVENIKTDRLFLAIYLIGADLNYNLENLQEDYPELICG